MTQEDFEDEKRNEEAEQMVGPTGKPIKSYNLNSLDIPEFNKDAKVDPRDVLKDEL